MVGKGNNVFIKIKSLLYVILIYGVVVHIYIKYVQNNRKKLEELKNLALEWRVT